MIAASSGTAVQEEIARWCLTCSRGWHRLGFGMHGGRWGRGSELYTFSSLRLLFFSHLVFASIQRFVVIPGLDLLWSLIACGDGKSSRIWFARVHDPGIPSRQDMADALKAATDGICHSVL